MTTAKAAASSPRRYEIWGNWKMNPPSLEDANALFTGIACGYADLSQTNAVGDREPAPFVPFYPTGLDHPTAHTVEIEDAFVVKHTRGDTGGVRVGLFVPHAYITELGRHPALKLGTPRNRHLQLGAQNMYYHEDGAFTGEHSPLMIRSLMEYVGQKPTVLIGHSERRDLFREDDRLINLKMLAAYNHGIRPFLAIGEQITDRETGKTEKVLATQLRDGLAGVSAQQFLGANTVIAYEPVWAIGTGETATPEMANKTHALIRRLLDDMFGYEVADRTTIQYGGSMKPENAAALLAMPHIDGGLIGGASLSAAQFLGIINAVPKLT